MKLYASLSAVTLIIILLACKASSPILKDVSKGLQSINRTVGEVNKIADDVQRIKTDVDYIRGNQASNPQPSQNGNTRLGNDKIGEQFQHIGAKKFPKCISGNCINGFGKLQLEEAALL